ncbi:hypothetical protein Tco_0805888 [Tanacetum coccineum]
METGSREGPSAPAQLAQTTPSSAFIKENIDMLRTMIKEHDQQTKTKLTLKKLTYDDSEIEGSESSKSKDLSKRSSDRSSRTAGTRSKVRSSGKSQRSLSRSKTSSHLRRYERLGAGVGHLRGPEYALQETQAHAFHYQNHLLQVPPEGQAPKEHKGVRRKQRSRGSSRHLLRCRGTRGVTHADLVRLNEGLQAFMDRFKSESSHIKGVPPVLRILAFMHGHKHPELAKKLNDKIPKKVDEMFERVRVFIRGEVAAWSVEIEEAVALGKLAHLVKDIRQGNQRNRGQGRGNVKNSLTNALIILEGNLPLPKVDRPRGNHGRTERKQNHHAGVRHSQMSLPYNVILGRMRMRSLSAVGSTIHSMVKFPTVNGVATLKTCKEALRECRQIEEMKNSWKETQWRQQMEQMSRIREQSILRNQNIPCRRLRKEPMKSEGSWEEDTVKEKVEVHDGRPNQPVLINGKLSIECRHNC